MARTCPAQTGMWSEITCLRSQPSIEQHAIATIISDMDAEIVALEARRGKTRPSSRG